MYEEYKWIFPNGCIKNKGINNGNIETFKDTPISSLGREICQNSGDARNNENEPVEVDFHCFEINTRDIPDVDNLRYAIQRGAEFWKPQDNPKADVFYENALNIINAEKISILRISDHNTKGLSGADEPNNTKAPWTALVMSDGASSKDGTEGGSFGIGKFASFANSLIRTVFYSTADKEGVCSYQGVARLTSFKDKSREITQGTGYYGNKKNTPVHTQISLDPNFKRDSKVSGTDIFVLGFKEDADWQRQIIASILDGFLYAIYIGNMIVDVDGIEISKKTLPDLMVKYKKDFKEHADEYYQALVDEKLARRFEKEITDDPELKGKLTLKLMIMPEFHRRAAMVRQTGMKIKDKGNISGLIPFAGVLSSSL